MVFLLNLNILLRVKRVSGTHSTTERGKYKIPQRIEDITKEVSNNNSILHVFKVLNKMVPITDLTCKNHFKTREV